MRGHKSTIMHECDTHEHHGEPGHVHDVHECDTHEHHAHA